MFQLNVYAILSIIFLFQIITLCIYFF